jgi:phosphohistidine phosphatase SixA
VITSSEAERARQDWERWLPHVQDLSVEVYAGLSPVQTLHHWN